MAIKLRLFIIISELMTGFSEIILILLSLLYDLLNDSNRKVSPMLSFDS